MTSARIAAALCLALAVASPALSAGVSGAGASRAAVAQAISDCRHESDRDTRLACYDRAADAFEQAQAQGQVVVVDRAQVQAVKRQAFGFSMPSLNFFGHNPGGREGKDDRVDVVAVKLAGAHQDLNGKWVLTTDEDAVWRQIDTTELNDSPRGGDAMVVRRAMLGSFFCKVGRESAIRCTRVQ